MEYRCTHYTGSAEPNKLQLAPNQIQEASYNRCESSTLVVEIKNPNTKMEPVETSKPRTEVTTMPEPTTLPVEQCAVCGDDATSNK